MGIYVCMCVRMSGCGWVSRCTPHATDSRTMRRLRLLLLQCVRMVRCQDGERVALDA